MQNDVYTKVIELAEKAGLDIKKTTEKADVMGTIDDNGSLQQCVEITPKGEDAVSVRAFTNYLSDTGMVVSKDWNGNESHTYKKADDAYNYLITSGLFNDQI